MIYPDEKKIQSLKEKALQIRIKVIEMLTKAQSGHTASSLGLADIFTVLYFHTLNYDSQKPNWQSRDRLILSNGHVAPLLYATLSLAGYFNKSELFKLRQLGSFLQGHPERNIAKGIETTSGPLGEGLGQACGIALSAKMDKKDFQVYCLMSDGEQQCGITWESAMFAASNNLNNITALIDRNNIQISGNTEDVMALEPLREKYHAFGWHVIDIDGHNFRQIVDAFCLAKNIIEKPVVIIAHTVAGKGVSSIEHDYNWHGKVPNQKESGLFIKELQS